MSDDRGKFVVLYEAVYGEGWNVGNTHDEYDSALDEAAELVDAGDFPRARVAFLCNDIIGIYAQFGDVPASAAL